MNSNEVGRMEAQAALAERAVHGPDSTRERGREGKLEDLLEEEVQWRP